MNHGNNKFKGVFIYIAVIFLLIVGMVTMLRMSEPGTVPKKYSDVISQFDNFNVTEYTLDLGSGQLVYKTKDGNVEKYTVPNVNLFLQDTLEYRKNYNEKNPGAALIEDFYPISDNSFLLSFLPYLLMIALMTK